MFKNIDFSILGDDLLSFQSEKIRDNHAEIEFNFTHDYRQNKNQENVVWYRLDYSPSRKIIRIGYAYKKSICSFISKKLQEKQNDMLELILEKIKKEPSLRLLLATRQLTIEKNY